MSEKPETEPEAVGDLRLSLSCPRRRLRYPNRLTLKATLNRDDGRPVAAARVMFEAELDDGFEPVANAVTDKNGTCAVALRVRRGRRYRARFGGDKDRAEAVSHSAAIEVIPRLDAELRTGTVTAGSRALVAGLIRPRKRYVRIEVEHQLSSQRWKDVGSREVRLVRGGFKAWIDLDEAGVYRCRVVFDGDALHAAAASGWFTVRAAGEAIDQATARS